MSRSSKTSETPASTTSKRAKGSGSDQSRRFINFAQEVETDDSPERFERVFGKVVPPKKAGDIAPKSKPSDKLK